MRMLAPSGRIVYSTCSMNPVENEAVVAAALLSDPCELMLLFDNIYTHMSNSLSRHIAFYLVDVSNQLSGLERRPGLGTWRPAVSVPGSSGSTNRNGINTSFATYAEWWAALSEAQRAEAKVGESHWPPTSEALNGKDLNLERW
jgi:multisite-specific tRNA:(cytosine-C5)-methyltransferase